MSDSNLYHDGSLALQEEFGSRDMAARLESLARTSFSSSDKEFIESAFYFFLATADAKGSPDCNFKGGPPGFVRVTSPNELAFPDYDGNGMFKSLGNVKVNPAVALLFINMHGQPRRLRILGEAQVRRDDPLAVATVGAQLMVRVKARAIFPNCPRNIPKMQMVEMSPFIPKWGEEPVEPAWKGFDEYRDVVHPRQKTPR